MVIVVLDIRHLHTFFADHKNNSLLNLIPLSVSDSDFAGIFSIFLKIFLRDVNIVEDLLPLLWALIIDDGRVLHSINT